MRFPRGRPNVLIAAGLLAATTLSVHAADAVPRGNSQFTLTLRDQPIEVFTHRPAGFTHGPLLVVLHGLNRNADNYRDHATSLADAAGMLVVAPRFDTNRFPTDAYQRGNVFKDGQVQPATEWTYSRVAELIREVRRRERRADMPVYLIGHSAGGQFLTRYAAFLPGDAVRIIAANPGSHLFPTRGLPFPYGFGGLPEELGGDDAIRRYLAAPLTLFLGTGDTELKNLDVTATAMKQGATRLERGRNCFSQAQQLAKAKGWAFNWRLVEAPGVGHSAGKMFAHPNAKAALLGEACVTEPPAKSELMKRATPAKSAR